MELWRFSGNADGTGVDTDGQEGHTARGAPGLHRSLQARELGSRRTSEVAKAAN
jgi:hypothetical protein